MIHLVNTAPLTPALHITSVAQTVFDLFRGSDLPQVMQQTLHRPIPAPEPNPEPNPAPDAVWQSSHQHDHIEPQDWDELFHAVQVRLEHCVDDTPPRTPQLALQDRQAVTKTTVLECVDAMSKLQDSLTLERHESQKPEANPLGYQH